MKLTPTYRLFILPLAILACAISSFAFGQGVGQGLDSTKPSIPEPEVPVEAIPLEQQDLETIDQKLAALSLDQKIMQLMFVRLSGDLAPSSVDNKLLQMLTPGGVLLPEMGGAGITIEYVNMVRKFESATTGSIPFFIGGNAFAISDSSAKNTNRFMHIPSLLSMSAADKNADTDLLFESIASNMERMGLNTHFGPSLTLSSAVSNPLSTMNTFGSDPNFTAGMSGALLNAFYGHNVLWMPSGFPGGEANRTGKGPATMLTSGSHFIERDGLPYFIAIKHGLPMIHVANTLAPMIDSEMRPASLSPTVITTLLKGTLDYQGLVISGPMDDPYIISKYEPEEAAVQSLLAGSDMILWSKTSPQIPKAIALISNAVQNGLIDEAIIDYAVRRILTLKMKFGLFERETPKDGQAAKIHRENLKLEAPHRIEKRSITLLKNDGNVLPLIKGTSTPLFVTGVVDLTPLKAVLSKELKSVNVFEIKTAKHTTRVQDFELRRLESMAKGVRTALCIFDNNVDAVSQSHVITDLKGKNLRVVVVLFGYPVDINAYKNADALLLVYGSSKFMDTTTDALAEILLGKAPIRALSSDVALVRGTGQPITFNVLDVIQSPTGRLPVSLEPFFPVGHFVSYAPQSIKGVHWDFGDNTRSTEHVVDHAYAQPGSYRATVTVEVDDGTTTSGTFAIDIQ